MISERPSLFTLRHLSCTSCGIPIRTNIKSRLLFIVSFGLLAAYHLYVKANGSETSELFIWAGLAAVMLPLIITLNAPRYEAGEQRASYSVLVNCTFYAVVGLLVAIWLYH